MGRYVTISRSTHRASALWLFAVAVAACLWHGSAFSALSQVEEYRLKAVFLERLTRFVEWPPQSGVEDPSSPFVLCVIGRNPFGTTLEALYRDRKIRDKKVHFRELTQPATASACHLLFIASSEAPRLDDILKEVGREGVLTVSDTPGFAEQGVIINFIPEDNRLRFEINSAAAKRSTLRVSYKLLELGKVINASAE